MALDAYERLIQLPGNDTTVLFEGYSSLVTINLQRQDTLEAAHYLEAWLDLANASGSVDDQRKVYLNLSVLEEQKANYLNALEYRKAYEAVADSTRESDTLFSGKKKAYSHRGQEIRPE